MKKLVAKVDLHDDKDRRKAMQVVSSFGGIESLNMDAKDSKITVSGDFDPIKVVKKLRKSWHTDIVSVGPAKEDGKKDEAKKNENQVPTFINPYQAPYPPAVTYYHMPQEEAPQCVIC